MYDFQGPHAHGCANDDYLQPEAREEVPAKFYAK